MIFSKWKPSRISFSLHTSYAWPQLYSPSSLFSPSNKLNFQKCANKSHLLEKRGDVKPTRKAAVLVPLCIDKDNNSSILFIKRTLYISRHSGDISFPGGIFEDIDSNLMDTAIREAHEEIGLPQTAIDIWSALKPFPSRDCKTLITPYVGYIGKVDPNALTLSKDEVANVIMASICNLSDVSNIYHTQFRTGMGLSLPIYLNYQNGSESQNLRIWGITAVILHHVLTLLMPDMYRHKIKYIPTVC